MKKVYIMVLLSMGFVIAIEPVNILRNSNFENDSIWVVEEWLDNLSEGSLEYGYTDMGYRGRGFLLNVIGPPQNYNNTSRQALTHYQYLTIEKRFEDLKTIKFFHRVTFQDNLKAHTAQYNIGVTYLLDGDEDFYKRMDFYFCRSYTRNPPYKLSESNKRKVENDTIIDAGIWVEDSINLENIMNEKSISPDQWINVFYTYNFAAASYDRIGQWDGQRLIWDEVRLFAIADTNVGVYAYRGDRVVENGELKPGVLVWVNGRADLDFLLNMTVFDEDSNVISKGDTLLSLESDDSTIVYFKSIGLDKRGIYTVVFRTGTINNNFKDECEEDDTLSYAIDYTEGIKEDTHLYRLNHNSIIFSERVSVYSVDGRHFFAKKGKSYTLSNGIYFVKVRDNTFRFLILP